MGGSSEDFPDPADTSAGTTEADSETTDDAPLFPSREDLGPDEEDPNLGPVAVSEVGVTPAVENLRDSRGAPSDQR